MVGNGAPMKDLTHVQVKLREFNARRKLKVDIYIRNNIINREHN